ncbi:hypothetical protein ACL6C3_21885 [Capilliphycus salinus ALCB114379]|uniref:hypothetical protein n=1 Tax=Capilliphycus salinus TaxID=2768948 RepID=UPI0039A71B7C
MKLQPLSTQVIASKHGVLFTFATSILTFVEEIDNVLAQASGLGFFGFFSTLLDRSSGKINQR